MDDFIESLEKDPYVSDTEFEIYCWETLDDDERAIRHAVDRDEFLEQTQEDVSSELQADDPDLVTVPSSETSGITVPDPEVEYLGTRRNYRGTRRTRRRLSTSPRRREAEEEVRPEGRRLPRLARHNAWPLWAAEREREYIARNRAMRAGHPWWIDRQIAEAFARAVAARELQGGEQLGRDGDVRDQGRPVTRVLGRRRHRAVPEGPEGQEERDTLAGINEDTEG